MDTLNQDKKRILIVEDEEAYRKILAFYIPKHFTNCEIQTAENGKKAMEFLEKEKFDLVLLDLIMPQMDGFQVLKEMKAKNIATPVLVLTNLGQSEDIKTAMELGAKNYYVKANTSIFKLAELINSMFT